MKKRCEINIDVNICHPEEFIARIRVAVTSIPPECRDRMDLEFTGIREPWDEGVHVDCTLTYQRDETIEEERMRLHLKEVDETVKREKELALLRLLKEKYND